MADIESIGIRAVFENLGGYLTGAKKMEDANKRLERSQVNLENVTNASSIAQRKAQERVVATTEATAQAVRAGNDKIAESKKNLERVEKAAADRITDSQRNIDKLTRNLNATAATETAKRIKLTEQLSAAEIKHSNLIVTQQGLVDKARRGVARTEEAVANTLAGSARAEIAAFQAVSDAALLSSGKIKQAQLGVAAAGGQVAKGTGAASVALRVFGAASNIAHGITQKLGSALIAVTGFSNRFAVALRFGAAAIGAFTLGAIISEASQFETALAKIDVLTNATAHGVTFLRDELLEMARTIPRSPDELGAAAYQVLSSGFDDVNEAAGITEKAAKAAALGLGTTEQVARVVTSVMNAYGHENINAAEATDILVAAIREGSAEAPDFVQNIGRLLGQAPALGVEFDQLAAAVAGLTNVGLPANQAVTALLGILNQLIDPAAGARDILKEYGTSIEEIRENIDTKGLLPALQEMLTLFGDNQQVLAELFPEVRGLTGALLLLRDEGSANIEILNGIRNAGGITEEGFARMSETFGFQAALLKNQLNVALIELGTAVLPTLTRNLQNIIGWLERNREGISSFAQAAVNAAVEIGKNFAAGLAVIQHSLSWIPSNEAKIVAAVLAIGAAFVIALGPASAAVAALVATIALLGAVDRAVDKVKDKLGVGSSGAKSSQDINSGFNDLVEQSAASGKAIGTGDTREALGRGAKSFTEAAIGRITADLNANAQKLREANTAEAQKKAAEEGEKLRIQLDEVTRAYSDQEIAAGGASKVTDALSDGIIDFSEATELGLSAVAAGALEAGKIQDEAKEKAFNFTKTLSLVANAFQRGADVAQRVVLNIAKTGFGATQAAASALFSRPTREIARLELALAKLRLTNSSLINSLDRQIADLQGSLSALDARDAQESFRDQQADISEQIRELEEQLRTAQKDERKGIQDQIDDLRDQSSDIVREAGRSAQRDAIQKEIDARQAQIDKLNEQENSIQRQIDFYNLQNEVLQKQITASDATLLSQGELTKAAQEVARVTAEQSVIIRDLSTALGVHLVPEMDEMTFQAELVRQAFALLNNETLRAQFIPTVETATKNTENLAVKADQATNSLDLFKAKMDEATTKTLQKFIEFGENGLPKPPENPFAAKAHGGFTYRPTMTLLGEGNKPELTLPLSDATRSRELLRSIPASLAAQIGLGGGGGGGSAFGDINVQGYVPAELETVVVNRIRRESARSRRANRLVGL